MIPANSPQIRKIRPKMSSYRKIAPNIDYLPALTIFSASKTSKLQ